MMKKGAIFDLDGVLVDTAKYHYFAWKELANELNIQFTEEDNERLKGISRRDSLDILLSLGNTEEVYSVEEKEEMLTRKNLNYLNYIEEMQNSEILPGAEVILQELKERGVKISLGSASKNAPLILEKTGLQKYFDAIVDGNSVSKAKPDPEVFMVGAQKLELQNEECVVFEDAEAGCQAAKAAGMYVVGIGEKENLPSSDITVSFLDKFQVSSLF